VSWIGDPTPPPWTPEDMWAAVKNYNVRPSGPWQNGLLTDNSAPGTGGIFVGQGGSAEALYPDFLNSAGSILTESLRDAIKSWGKGVISGSLDIEDVPSFIRPNVDHFISVQGGYRDQPGFEDEPPNTGPTPPNPTPQPALDDGPLPDGPPTENYTDEPAVENKGALDWWLKNGDRTNAGQRFAHLSDEQKDYLVANDPSLAPEFGRGGVLADQPAQNYVDTIDSQIEDPNIVDQDLIEGDLSGLDEESLLNSFQGQANETLSEILDRDLGLDRDLSAVQKALAKQMQRQIEAEMLRGGGIGIRWNTDEGGSIDIIGRQHHHRHLDQGCYRGRVGKDSVYTRKDC